MDKVKGVHGLGYYLDFKGQFIASDTETQMYEREFYDELYNSIKGNGSRYYLFLGNPGIGKSCFGMYLVYRFIRDGKEIIYQSDKGPVYWIQKDQVLYSADYSKQPGFLIGVEIGKNPDIIYITDGNIQPAAVSLPLNGSGGCVIAVASTQCIEKQLHEYKKTSYLMRYYVPRFKEQEIEELFKVHSNIYNYTFDQVKLRVEYLGSKYIQSKK